MDEKPKHSQLSLYEFNSLSIDDKADVLWEHGALVKATDHPVGRSAFYTLSDFYVEVVMRQEDFEKAMKKELPMRIHDVKAFKKGDRLDGLASTIDLGDLL